MSWDACTAAAADSEVYSTAFQHLGFSVKTAQPKDRGKDATKSVIGGFSGRGVTIHTHRIVTHVFDHSFNDRLRTCILNTFDYLALPPQSIRLFHVCRRISFTISYIYLSIQTANTLLRYLKNTVYTFMEGKTRLHAWDLNVHSSRDMVSC